MSLVSSLYARGAGNPLTEAEKDEALRENWRAYSDIQGLRISAIRDEIIRRAIVNELSRQHGARPKRRA